MERKRIPNPTSMEMVKRTQIVLIVDSFGPLPIGPTLGAKKWFSFQNE
ncbi:hypothetical protein [Ammoniphilus sp. 3BR4]